jgi:hypothetical protein
MGSSIYGGKKGGTGVFGKKMEVLTRMAEGLEEPLACDKRNTMAEITAWVRPARVLQYHVMRMHTNAQLDVVTCN